MVYRNRDGYVEISGGFPAFNSELGSKERALADIVSAYHEQINQLISEKQKITNTCNSGTTTVPPGVKSAR